MGDEYNLLVAGEKREGCDTGALRGVYWKLCGARMGGCCDSPLSAAYWAMRCCSLSCLFGNGCGLLSTCFTMIAIKLSYVCLLRFLDAAGAAIAGCGSGLSGIMCDWTDHPLVCIEVR